MKFSEFLRQERLKQNLTQKELSKLIKLSREQVNLVENDRLIPSYKTINAVANYFKVSKSTICEMIEKEKNENNK